MTQIDATNAAAVAQGVKNGMLPGPAKTLAEALARIYADGGRYVQKTGQMQGPMRYSYAKEGDFIAAIRPLMETHGVTIRPRAVEAVLTEVIETQTQNGTRRQNRAVVRVTFELLHTSGDKADVQTFGEGIDSGDKAFNKAMTGAMKYAMRQTFCVETGDDPDDTPSHEQERAKPAARDNLPLRAKATQALAQAQNRGEVTDLIARIRADVAAGNLSAADADSLRVASRGALAMFPQKQPAGAN